MSVSHSHAKQPCAQTQANDQKEIFQLPTPFKIQCTNFQLYEIANNKLGKYESQQQ